MHVTVIGGGLIGASWAALFLAHGHRVCVHDVAPGVEARVRQELQRIQPFMAQLGLPLDPHSPALSFDGDLARAVRQADVVQECGPERLAFKQSLWVSVESHCRPDALLLSSSSGITASMQSRKMASPQRMLVGHPFNPPHLIPLVEVVPGRRTSAEATERARQFYLALGKQAIVLRKEIPGFVANRIQAAVIRESVSLVRQGVVSVEDLDTAVQSSLGLRWACGGPFLSAHLGGGAGGIGAFFKQFAGGLQLLWLHMRLRPVLLTGGAQRALAQQIEQRYGAQSIDQWASRRDQQQIALLQALQRPSQSE
ncbi:MAG TPA: 3-hydroxyacyl-CoA dehydrogenase NAD-binding domain-containing protein [Aquabacterium sp.]|uniref:3-hydroxyacyl-CoA dehydrogenase NAD-binding domain-containing protein n=1 Tax=Aquabacterium sp. TaxID=1872578 RepID=UPI002E33294A|nr:3-hydroxyacyl-CoA dehydrogenase NAD-binding domain-containing protein [Aquabacterium sp.]HEX5371917.1 3-hydroxyacyl-CoA dehydrogenase NAD-binding domain-containing protein [Aquabacterium sp.]